MSRKAKSALSRELGRVFQDSKQVVWYQSRHIEAKLLLSVRD